jgi:hypothetical protein
MRTKTIQRVGYLCVGILLTYMAVKSCEKKPMPRVHTPSVASAEQSLVPDWYGKYTGRKDRYLNQIYNGKD